VIFLASLIEYDQKVDDPSEQVSFVFFSIQILYNQYRIFFSRF